MMGKAEWGGAGVCMNVWLFAGRSVCMKGRTVFSFSCTVQTCTNVYIYIHTYVTDVYSHKRSLN